MPSAVSEGSHQPKTDARNHNFVREKYLGLLINIQLIKVISPPELCMNKIFDESEACSKTLVNNAYGGQMLLIKWYEFTSTVKSNTPSDRSIPLL